MRLRTRAEVRDRMAKVVNLWRTGLSMLAISERLGISPSSVRQTLVKMGETPCVRRFNTTRDWPLPGGDSLPTVRGRH